MAEDRNLFDMMDAIAAGQSQILNEIANIKKSSSNSDSRIDVLENKVENIQNRPVQPKPQPRQVPQQQNETTIIRTFLKKAKKSWMWFGTNASFNKSKKFAIVSLIALIIVGTITTIVASACFKMYSTFTLFENIWLIFSIVTLAYSIKANKIYEAKELANSAPIKFVSDELDMYFPKNDKKAFTIFKWLAIVSVVCNIICIWTSFGKAVKGAATIFELLFLVTIILSWVATAKLFRNYTIIYVEGHNLTTNEKVVIAFTPGDNGPITETELKRKYPFLFE